MSNKANEVQADGKPQLSLFNFFTIGFGAIIGTGWVLLVGDWMCIGGGPIPAIIAFILGAIFLMPIGACFGELTAAIPIAGGIVEYVDRTYGSTMSYVTGWLLCLGNGILCPWEAIAISKIITDRFALLPGMGWLTSVKLYTILGADVYLFPTLIALAFALYVVKMQFAGADSAAKLQGFLTKALLGGMILAMCVSFATGSPDNVMPVFSTVTPKGGVAPATTATNFLEGFIAVLVMTPFFYAGFDTIPQQAEEASDDLDWNKFGKIIPLALGASAIFYMICIYAFGSIIDWHEFVNMSVPALACLENINMFLYLAMLVVATLGPLGPMNSFFGATARIMLAMGRKGQLPEKFTELDPNSGTPMEASKVMAILTLVGPFLGGNMLVPLTNVSALAFIFSCAMVALATLKMRRTEPELDRPYKVPMGNFGVGLGVFCGFSLVALMVIPGSPAALNATEWAITIAWLVIGFVLKSAAGKKQAA